MFIPCSTCNEMVHSSDAGMTVDEHDCQPEQPTWSKPCERCNTTVERWRGQGDVTCHKCGAEYNAGGQRLRDDWRGNPSTWDDEVGDLEGYEIQHAGDE